MNDSERFYQIGRLWLTLDLAFHLCRNSSAECICVYSIKHSMAKVRRYAHYTHITTKPNQNPILNINKDIPTNSDMNGE